MNKITYILAVLVSLSSYAQISVYQHDYPLDYTNTRINNLPNVEYNTFIRLNETEQHTVQTPISKTLKASDRIQIKPNFKGGPFNGGGLFKATMCNLNRDVVCLSHNELTDIEALKKFEIGIGLPDFLKDKIQTFIDTEDTINGINPYLSWQFDVKVTYKHTTSGYTDTIFGFYYQDYSAVYNTGTYYDGWTKQPTTYKIRARYAPKNIPGRWKGVIQIKTKDTLIEYCPFDFNVNANSEDGYIKVAANNHVLEQNGNLFFPVGQNLPWPRNWGGGHCEWHTEPCGAYSQYLYRQYVDSFANEGGKSFRLLINPYSLEVEYEKVGIYTDRLQYAWELDNIVNLAEQRDLYIDFNLQLHTQFEEVGAFHKFNWDWHNDNTDPVVGGSINAPPSGYREDLNLSSNPLDFLTSPLAKKYYKQKMKYYISRYGYSTHISMFELMSEMNNIGNRTDYVLVDNVPTRVATYIPYHETPEIGQYCEDWHKEIATFIKDEIYHKEHILKIDYTGTDGAKNPYDDSYSLNEIDVNSWNDYSNATYRFYNKSGTDTSTAINTRIFKRYNKPVYNSETGPLGINLCDNNVTVIRDAWMMPFSGIAGCSMWSNEKNVGVFKHLGNAQRFLETDPEISDLFLGTWIADRADNDDPTTTSSYLKEILYVKNNSDDLIVGVINNLTSNFYTERDVSLDTSDCLLQGEDTTIVPEEHRTKYDFLSQDFSILTIKNVPPGFYDVMWFDPLENQYFDTTEVQVLNNNTGIINHPTLCVSDSCKNINKYYPQLVFKMKRNYNKMASVHSNNNLTQHNLPPLLFDFVEPEEYGTLTQNETEQSFLELQLFPNPANNIINAIIYGKLTGQESIEIMDVSGKILYSSQAKNRSQIDISHLATGTYFIKLTGIQQKITKFIKK